jgi:hypothetical protein
VLFMINFFYFFVIIDLSCVHLLYLFWLQFHSFATVHIVQRSDLSLDEEYQ